MPEFTFVLLFIFLLIVLVCAASFLDPANIPLMPHITEVKYSRSACIAAVREYYSFLAYMYLKEGEVRIMDAPVGGWPSISVESLAPFGKTDEVGMLLRHLPYVVSNRVLLPHCGPATYFADWTTNIFHMGIGFTTVELLKGRTEASCRDIPSHCIGITDGHPGDGGSTFILDTKIGIIHWLKCPLHLRNDSSRELVKDDRYSFVALPESHWRATSGAWAVVDFFEMLKDKFRQLQFIPINGYQVYDIRYTRPEHYDKVVTMMRIYKEYGWPHCYRKRECIETIQRTYGAWVEERARDAEQQAEAQEEKEEGKGKGKEKEKEKEKGRGKEKGKEKEKGKGKERAEPPLVIVHPPP